MNRKVKTIIDEKLLALCAAGVDHMLRDPYLKEVMERSNQVSLAEQLVEHGYDHAMDVWSITAHVIALLPDSFTQFFKLTALAGAILHDMGRVKGSKDHALNGAILARKYLMSIRIDGQPLPREFVNRVVFVVRNHRAESWLNLQRARPFDAPDIVAVLIADKLSGTEARLTEEKLSAMKQLAGITITDEFRQKYQLDQNWSLARLPMRRADLYTEAELPLVTEAQALINKHGLSLAADLEIDRHDQVNGSIFHREINLTDEYLEYSILVDERLATLEHITTLDWWSDALTLACECASYFGLQFLLQFNGQYFSRVGAEWQPILNIAS